jgi:hypothetical protein
MSDAKTTEPTVQGSVNRLLLKAKYSFYSTLVFAIFANPETYRILNQYLGSTITDRAGVPTLFGFFVSAALFFCTMIGLMLLPS